MHNPSVDPTVKRIPLQNLRIDPSLRDRMALEELKTSEDMTALMASIRMRGQLEPIQVDPAGDGTYHLRSGWRRVTALTNLHTETGDDRFAMVQALIGTGQGGGLLSYIHIAERNLQREDLTFAEMAHFAIAAAKASGIDTVNADHVVNRLYHSLHKVKRSYIRSFVKLLDTLGEALRWPKAVSRDVGVAVARALAGAGQETVEALKLSLSQSVTPEAQAKILAQFLRHTCQQKPTALGVKLPPTTIEFAVGDLKVELRPDECRIFKSGAFASVDKERLKAAISAFERVLRSG